ncbi:hypothetical protein M8J77_013578 [Diaphorina citri]|nr:hypothetical protein M8J77_013578 [Diaphorina citri]
MPVSRTRKHYTKYDTGQTKVTVQTRLKLDLSLTIRLITLILDGYMQNCGDYRKQYSLSWERKDSVSTIMSTTTRYTGYKPALLISIKEMIRYHALGLAVGGEIPLDQIPQNGVD